MPQGQEFQRQLRCLAAEYQLESGKLLIESVEDPVSARKEAVVVARQAWAVQEFLKLLKTMGATGEEPEFQLQDPIYEI